MAARSFSNGPREMRRFQGFVIRVLISSLSLAPVSRRRYVTCIAEGSISDQTRQRYAG